MYGLLQHPRRILGFVFPVALVGFCECLCRVIRFFEVIGLDCCRALEGLPGFFAGLLHAESVGGLGVELDGFFVFLRLAAEERETAAGARSGFVCLETVRLWSC